MMFKNNYQMKRRSFIVKEIFFKNIFLLDIINLLSLWKTMLFTANIFSLYQEW